jgi:hypothetical protein
MAEKTRLCHGASLGQGDEAHRRLGELTFAQLPV